MHPCVIFNSNFKRRNNPYHLNKHWDWFIAEAADGGSGILGALPIQVVKQLNTCCWSAKTFIF